MENHMYEVIFDMVYRYTEHGLQFVGNWVEQGFMSAEAFAYANKQAFL